MGHSLPGTLQQSAVGTSQGSQSIKQPELMVLNISPEHLRYPCDQSTAQGQERCGFNRGVFERTEIFC